MSLWRKAGDCVSGCVVVTVSRLYHATAAVRLIERVRNYATVFFEEALGLLGFGLGCVGG